MGLNTKAAKNAGRGAYNFQFRLSSFLSKDALTLSVNRSSLGPSEVVRIMGWGPNMSRDAGHPFRRILPGITNHSQPTDLQESS